MPLPADRNCFVCRQKSQPVGAGMICQACACYVCFICDSARDLINKGKKKCPNCNSEKVLDLQNVVY